VDNIFVFMAIFTSFGVKDAYQHRILYFGILSAMVLRFIFVAAGTSLLLLGKWVLLFCGVLVLWSAWQPTCWKSQKTRFVISRMFGGENR